MLLSRFFDEISTHHSERGYIIDARTFRLPGGESCAEILYKALGYVPEFVVRLRQGCGSKPLLIFDRKTKEKMKLYWTRTREAARNIVEITSLLEAKKVPIPKVYRQIGPYILSQWIEGVPLRKQLPFRYAKAMARYQSRFHGASVDSPIDSSLYVQRILSLFQKKRSVWLSGMSKTDVDILYSLLREEAPVSLAKGIRHSDIRTYNLVKSKDGSIYSIDNENLRRGVGFEYDIFKTVYFTFRKTPWHIPRYLIESLYFIPHNTILAGWNFWNLLVYGASFLFEIEIKGGKNAEIYRKILKEAASLREKSSSKGDIFFQKSLYNAIFFLERSENGV